MDRNQKEEINSNKNYVFSFGDVGRGKTTLSGALLHFFANEHTLKFISTDKSYREARQISWKLITGLDNKKFPNRTRVGDVTEINTQIKFENDNFQQICFLEMSGEDLREVDSEIDDVFIEYAKVSKIFFLVTDVDNAKTDDITFHSFLTLLASKGIRIENIALVISKWDLVESNTNLLDFTKKNLGLSFTWLKDFNNPQLFNFSIGKVDGISLVEIDYSDASIIGKWLFDSLSKKSKPKGIFGRIKDFFTGGNSDNKKTDEDSLWDNATSLNTIDSYLNFIKIFPKSRFTKEAKRRMDVIAEENLWEKARVTNSIETYLAYIKKYPKGIFIKNAREYIRQIEEKNTWEKAKSINTIAGFQEYLDKFPIGIFVAEAKNYIKNIQDIQGIESLSIIKKKQGEIGISPAVKYAEGKNHILAIAIDMYNYLPMLKSCVRDVLGITDVLINDYTFEKENVINLFNENATRKNILQAFEDYSKTLTKADNLVIIFAGHGHSEKEKSYWIPVDAERMTKTEYISVNEIKDYINSILAQHILLIVDAANQAPFINKDRYTPIGTKYSSRFALVAGGDGRVLDGSRSGHSPFAGEIINFLKSNKDLSIAVSKLAEHVCYIVDSKGQKPLYGGMEGNQGGQFFLNKREIVKLEQNLLTLIVSFNNQNSDVENKEIENWYSKHQNGQLYLAAFAAFPLHITVDLLYKIWQNFKNTEGVEIPRIAVSDLLLSGLLQETSTGVFEYPPDLRRHLLQAAQQYFAAQGRDIVKEMATFMLDYLATHYTEGVAYTEPIREAEEWNALAYLDPAAANARLAQALNPSAQHNYQTRQLRAALLTENLHDHAPIRNLEGNTQADFQRVLTFSKGMKYHIQGKVQEAYQELKGLAEFGYDAENGGNTEGVAELAIPKTLIPKPEKEDILNENTETIELLEANLIILGAPRVGKTSLVWKLINESSELPKAEEAKKRIEFFNYEFKNQEGKTIKVNIKDFGGQQIYHSIHQSFLNKHSLYLLVYSSDNSDTEYLEYWLSTIEILADKSPVLIIQNKIDIEVQPSILKRLEEKFQNIKGYHSISLMTLKGVKDLKTEIELNIQELPHIGNKMPKKWVAIRQEIEKLASVSDYISIDEFLTICKKHQISKEEDSLFLSRYLHDLGIIFHFQQDDLLKNFIVLSPSWATEAICQLLDSELIRNKKGIFTEDDIKIVWNKSRFNNKQNKLLALLNMFEFVYKTTNTDGVNTWLLPQLFPNNRPEFEWHNEENLIVKYIYGFLPKFLFTSFLVRKSYMIKGGYLLWRHGVILEQGDSTALITENADNNEIIIRTNGSKSKELLSLVIEDFEDIHTKYSNLKVEQKVVIPYKLLGQKDKIRQLVGEARLREALQLLRELELVEDTEIIQLSAHFSEAERMNMKNLISQQDYSMQIKRISMEILSLLDKMIETPISKLDEVIRSIPLNDDAEIGLLQLVNCNRIKAIRKFTRAFDAKRNQQVQFYFICGCPTELPGSLGERILYEIMNNESLYLNEQINYPYEKRTLFNRLRIEHLPFSEGNLEASKKKFKEYIQRRFGLPNTQNFEKFIEIGMVELPFSYVATVFRIPETLWEEEEGEIVEYLQWIIDTFTFRKPQPNQPTFIFLFVVQLRYMYDAEKIRPQSKRIITELEAFCQKNDSIILDELMPLKEIYLEDWLYGIGVVNVNDIARVIETFAQSLKPEDKFEINGERHFHMKDVEALQLKIITHFRNKG
ncbi:MAG: COR domain-containing protein [Saprospiraceae bacterium]|nr:COR domain-containing protein [Saprospiraceae bacterium]